MRRIRRSLPAAVAAVLVAGCVIAPGGQYDRLPPQDRGVERVYNVPPPHVEPPPPFKEPRPHQPSPAYVWLPGYWDWDGARYFWQPGRWVVAPNDQVWEAHRWIHNSKRGWVLIEGFWRDANTSSSR